MRFRGHNVRRRQFIALLGAAAAGWPLLARAQAADRVRRIGLLAGLADTDPAAQAEILALRQGLRELGWIEGRNLAIEYRFAGADPARLLGYAQELAQLNLDVVLSRATPPTAALMQAARNTPIVFVVVAEPIASGFVQSLARPGGNLTGFTNFEASVGGKWVDLLKEISPRVARVALMFNPKTAPYAQAFLAAAQAAGPSLGTQPFPAPVNSPAEIEATIVALGGQPGSGLICITDSFMTEHRDLIIQLAARHRIPAVYANRGFAPAGGLMSYAADFPDLFRRAAGYVDRILKGAKPSDLPVQAPTKFELSINLKTAMALGLDPPAALIARADEVIE